MRTDGVDAYEIQMVLSQPTRARLFTLLRDADEPIATGELAERTGLHPNGVRNHLERLWRAGLVDRGRSSSRRGRPRDEWIVTETGTGVEAALALGDSGGGDALAAWLARAFPHDRSHLPRIESVGKEAGLAMPVEEGGNPKKAFLEVLNRLGFAATVDDAEGGFTCRLGRCPYREAARENSDVVCAMHRGFTRGLLESIDSGFRLRDFEVRDPDQAGCLIKVGVEGKAS